MFDENEPQAAKPNDISVNCDLSTFSVGDLDDRITLLEREISRLKEERKNKTSSLEAAQSFFKT
ncbi:MAG: DUF1192 domain-containing protein [Rhizobiaceae bacterium]